MSRKTPVSIFRQLATRYWKSPGLESSVRQCFMRLRTPGFHRVIRTSQSRIIQIRLHLEVGTQELWNYTTQTFTPPVPAADALKTLETLGSIVEDDFLFLMPVNDGDGYQLKAFVFCFPNGFDMRKKLNLKLRPECYIANVVQWN
ncbi:hypothetical protein LTR93_011545 [Exophiala xenobiotica]|nr:hypothetical protein LTR93_011545 [Exophiala xenobiotica]